MSTAQKFARTPSPARTGAPPGLRTLLRLPLLLAVLVTLPALTMRIGGLHLGAVPQLLVFGAAVVGASFLLAWAAEAAQLDVSGGLAIAVLAVIVVLPEYAVDLFYAWTAGHDPAYAPFAAANMTGSNRLLLGIGWPVVVLVSLAVARRANTNRTGSDRGNDNTDRQKSARPHTMLLEPGNRLELGFLLVAGVLAFIIPVTGQIHIVLGVVLLGWFGFYLFRLTRGEVKEPDLVGTAASVGALPQTARRVTVSILLIGAAGIILACAEPFATSLVDAGTTLGVDRFLLVQWLAPLASEAPEFIVAIIFASRGKGVEALAILISSKVNQWTLLVGSLPIAQLIGGGTGVLVLDVRQVEEMYLTATQTMMGVAIVLALRFHRASALALLGLFLIQFPLTGESTRLILSAVYALLAYTAFLVNRDHLWPTIRAPFTRTPGSEQPDTSHVEREASQRHE